VQLVVVDSHGETLPLVVWYAITARVRRGVAVALQPGCNDDG